LGFESVLEGNAGDDVWQQFCAVQGSPAFRRRLHEPIDHRQARFSRAVAFGLAMPLAHRGERALDRVRRAQVQPVLSWEVIERQ
jgi:hypothetical protein